jgi:transcriptional/translational regulatory protein YebC/TACO1
MNTLQSFLSLIRLQKTLEMGRAFEFRKARKMKRWSAMAKTFTRIGKDIVMAVKEGGPDPRQQLLAYAL